VSGLPLLGVAALLAAACALRAGRAGAAETQWWTSRTAADHTRSQAEGVVVDPDGVLRLGPLTASFPAESLVVAWSLAVLKDGSIAVGGERGRVMRWSESGGWRLWARLGSGQVLALAAHGDGAVAGTGGAVFAISARGDTTRLATTGERYVWGLAPAGEGAWYAATGTRGRLLKVSRGRSEVVLDTEEGNLVSLAPDGRGGVLAGGDSRGRLYHVARSGAARTLLDAAEDEIRAIAVDGEGTAWAAALSVSAAASEESDAAEGPQPARAPVTGGRSVVYRVTPEGASRVWWSSPQPLVFALATGPRGLVAATGNRAGVHRIERALGSTLLLAPPQGQVTALAAAGERVWAATSNPVVLWRLGPGPAREGTLISPVLDAGRFARFGRLRSEGRGTPGFATRSGNGDAPDTTWSRWQAVAADGAIASPPGRFLQWRVRLDGRDEAVSEVAVSRREPNLPPHVEELSVAPQGQGFREGELSPRTEAVTQTLPGGQKVEYSATITRARGVSELPLWARGLRTLQWRASDPNGDPLRARVLVRAEPEGDWIEIGKDLDATLLTWNTNTLPDGRYRLKVEVSDREGNAVGEELTGEMASEPFRVDNTPPAVTALEASVEAGRVVLSGAAADREGWIQRLDLSVDDGPWRLLSPDGGFADAPRLTFRVPLADLAAGPHLLSVRAVDAAGNAATRAVHVTAPRAR